MSREAVYQGLFTALKQALPSAKTVERKLRHWNQVAETEMPYVAVVVHHQTSEQKNNLPYRWRLGAMVVIYSMAEDQNQYPSTLLNNLLDELETALKPSVQGIPQNFSLPNIEAVRIEGVIEISEGLVNEGNIVMAMAPIVMLAGPYPGSP